MVTVQSAGKSHRLDGLAGAIVRGVLEIAPQLDRCGDRRVKIEINRAGTRLVIKPIVFEDEVRVEIDG